MRGKIPHRPVKIFDSIHIARAYRIVDGAAFPRNRLV
jgi:hypothetical protein